MSEQITVRRLNLCDRCMDELMNYGSLYYACGHEGCDNETDEIFFRKHPRPKEGE